MFWNMDVGEQEQDLMEISHFLLSVFEFAKNQPGNVFQKRTGWTFHRRTAPGFTLLYERDTDNGKNMRRAVGKLFRMDQEKREEIYEAVKHDMEFMDKRPGKRKIQPGK